MSLSTHIFVFAIGRGSAAFVRSGLNQGFILDMGGGDLFDPARFVAKRLVPGLDEYKENTIAQAILSHPHKDHIAQCGSLAKGKLYPTLLTCPTDHPDLASCEQVDWSRLGWDDPDKKDLKVHRLKAMGSGDTNTLSRLKPTFAAAQTAAFRRRSFGGSGPFGTS